MKLISISVLAIGALTAGLAVANAQSLEMRKFQSAQQAGLDKALDLTNQRCGSKISGTFDWKSFSDPDLVKKDPVAWCVAALDAMEDLCADAMGKEAIQSKVKSLTCASASEPTADLSADGAVSFAFALGPNQNKLLVRSVLEKKL